VWEPPLVPVELRPLPIRARWGYEAGSPALQGGVAHLSSSHPQKGKAFHPLNLPASVKFLFFLAFLLNEEKWLEKGVIGVQ